MNYHYIFFLCLLSTGGQSDLLANTGKAPHYFVPITIHSMVNSDTNGIKYNEVSLIHRKTSFDKTLSDGLQMSLV